jgi:hypothetical protein
VTAIFETISDGGLRWIGEGAAVSDDLSIVAIDCADQASA